MPVSAEARVPVTSGLSRPGLCNHLPDVLQGGSPHLPVPGRYGYRPCGPPPRAPAPHRFRAPARAGESAPLRNRARFGAHGHLQVRLIEPSGARPGRRGVGRAVYILQGGMGSPEKLRVRHLPDGPGHDSPPGEEGFNGRGICDHGSKARDRCQAVSPRREPGDDGRHIAISPTRLTSWP